VGMRSNLPDPVRRALEMDSFVTFDNRPRLTIPSDGMRYRQTEQSRPAPLSPQVFQILVSLLDGPRHGYAVIQDIRERTQDEIRLTASTLYDALARLHDQGWIDETDGPGTDEPVEGRSMGRNGVLPRRT